MQNGIKIVCAIKGVRVNLRGSLLEWFVGVVVTLSWGVKLNGSAPSMYIRPGTLCRGRE